MDISLLKQTTRIVQILSPVDKTPLGIEIEVVSLDDDSMKQLKRNILDRKLFLEQRGKNFKAEEIETNRINLLFTATRGWTWKGDANFEGEKPDFNRRNFEAVCAKLSWFTDQIDEAVGEKEAFFSNSGAI
jgi:hypothetical protein